MSRPAHPTMTSAAATPTMTFLVRVMARSVDPRCALLDAVLSQHDSRRTSRVVDVERELSVDDLVKELPFRRREDLNDGLTGQLRKQPGILSTDREHDTGTEFVTSHVALEDGG